MVKPTTHSSLEETLLSLLFDFSFSSVVLVVVVVVAAAAAVDSYSFAAIYMMHMRYFFPPCVGSFPLIPIEQARRIFMPNGANTSLRPKPNTSAFWIVVGVWNKKDTT